MSSSNPKISTKHHTDQVTSRSLSQFKYPSNLKVLKQGTMYHPRIIHNDLLTVFFDYFTHPNPLWIERHSKTGLTVSENPLLQLDSKVSRERKSDSKWRSLKHKHSYKETLSLQHFFT